MSVHETVSSPQARAGDLYHVPPEGLTEQIWRQSPPRSAKGAADLLAPEIAAVSLAGKFRIRREWFDHKEWLWRGDWLDVSAARNLYKNRRWVQRNYRYVPGPPGEDWIRKGDGSFKKSGPAFDAWLADPDRMTFNGVAFDPRPVLLARGERPHQMGFAWSGDSLNLWMGHRYSKHELRSSERYGSFDLFDDHLLDNVCKGDEKLWRWLWSWMSNLFQKPHQKPGTALVLVGDQGVGKSIVGQVLGRLCHPDHFVQLSNRQHLTGKFNAHLANRILVQADELFWRTSQDAAAALKSLVTEPKMLMELKGVDAVPVANHARLIITSNAHHVVPAALEERRFAVFPVGDRWRGDREAFGAMLGELRAGGYKELLATLMDPWRHPWLFEGVQARPDPGIIPSTAGLLDQKLRSLPPVWAWWRECLSMERVTEFDAEWPDEIERETFRRAFTTWARERRINDDVGPSELGRELRKVCPDLADRYRRGDDGRRCRSYRLPALESCRRAFEAAVGGEVDW